MNGSPPTGKDKEPRLKPPTPTRIFHITDVDNLGRILNDGGLHCKQALDTQAVPYTNVAYDTVQDRRARTRVPCGPGGPLHNYVPFYFAPRSPMLYTINRGNVPGRGQRSVVHLVSTVEAVVAAKLAWVFTDGHAIMGLTEFFDDLADLGRIDWNIMREQYWADTQSDGDRSRRRQAEFLVHGFFPWNLVLGIGVLDDTIRKQVEAALGSSLHRPQVRIVPKWYY